jgi:hypothetical protein
MFAIAVLTVAVGTAALLDLVFRPRLTSSGEYVSNAQKISRLYNALWDIERSRIPVAEGLLSLDERMCLGAIAGYRTARTLLKYAKEDVLTKIYAPERLNDRELIIVQYYLNGHWHKAIVRHPRFPAREILEAKGVSGSEETNATIKIKEYAGPGGDFFGQRVTPRSLGYDRVILTVLSKEGRKELHGYAGTDDLSHAPVDTPERSRDPAAVGIYFRLPLDATAAECSRTR